jgi:hypothetical protein
MVLFFENFHVHLVWLHRTCGNGLSGQGSFFAAHASRHVLMFGALLANGFATWRGAIAQSGCLSFGSLLANQRRQSAIRHRFVNCPSCGGQCAGSRWQANAQRASRSRGFATPVRRPKSWAPSSQASRPPQSMWSAIALSPGNIEQWPGLGWKRLFAACPLAVRAVSAPIKWEQNAINRTRKGSVVMQRPNVSNEMQVFVFSTPSPSRASLTVGSTRTKMLRIFAG